jgi:outer membrane protein assembly factor BamD (BamD/ComL family)
MGNLAIASSRYEAVATKFSDLPAAESALYAAARIEARQKHDDAARALYDRYLANYPNGRYADDVRRQRRLK